MSGGIVERAAPSVRLSRISNPRAPLGRTLRTDRRAIRAAGGASARSRPRNREREDPSPSTRTTTAPGVFSTHPDRPQAAAIRWTKGRNPTPWTVPRTVISIADSRSPGTGVSSSFIRKTV